MAGIRKKIMWQKNEGGIMQNLLGKIGNTPSANVDGITVKLEYFNPSGSIKDRFVFPYLEKLFADGKIANDVEIVEATTGNTGISIAMWAALRGVRFTAYMPSNASQERILIIKGYGAQVVQAPTVGEAVALKNAHLAREQKAVTVDQFGNIHNPLFMQALGEELLLHKPEVFVAGAGTGGTIIGVARVLKKKLGTKIVVLEPTQSPMLTDGKPGIHLIEGVGEDFIPDIISRERNLIDEVGLVCENEALDGMKALWKRGMFVGASSAANLIAAKRYAKDGARVATLFPDNGYRYFVSR